MDAPLTPTRGWGFLEGFLARQRAAMVNRLVSPGRRTGILLDLGCGQSPTFLMNTEFAFKVGIDKVNTVSPGGSAETIALVRWNMEEGGSNLPLADVSCDMVTMLAVLEHVSSGRALNLLRDVDRVLKNDGACVLTTPAAWTDRLLRTMAAVKLVSLEEINDHKAAYTIKSLTSLLRKAFPTGNVRTGRFQASMNLWAEVRKAP